MTKNVRHFCFLCLLSSLASSPLQSSYSNKKQAFFCSNLTERQSLKAIIFRDRWRENSLSFTQSRPPPSSLPYPSGTASCLDGNQLAKSSAVSLRTFAAPIQALHLPLSLIKIDPNFVAEQAARESSQTKQDWYAEMRRRRDEEHEAKEHQLEEEAKARQAKEEEAAGLEFEKWKGEFSVDAEGTTENEVQENQDLLSEFVEYIKKHKCVPLEDLSAEFRLRTQDCINRITSLESIGKLSGVMDDRGKYIYISPEEMKAVADYMKRQGRVSISHLASKSNQFIDLEPKAAQFADEIAGAEEIVAT